jgi:hypothetical protein
MTNTLNQIIFFSTTKIRIFFQQHWESEYFFRKKTYPSFKLNGRSLNKRCFKWVPVKGETKRNKSKRNEIYWNEVNFVSFRFRFAFYSYTHKDAVFQWCLLDSKSNWHNFHIFSSFYFIFSQSKNRITNQLHVFNPTKLQRELPFNLKRGEGAFHFFYKIFRFWSLEEKNN